LPLIYQKPKTLSSPKDIFSVSSAFRQLFEEKFLRCRHEKARKERASMGKIALAAKNHPWHNKLTFRRFRSESVFPKIRSGTSIFRKTSFESDEKARVRDCAHGFQAVIKARRIRSNDEDL
jgi:hypothetical protein